MEGSNINSQSDLNFGDFTIAKVYDHNDNHLGSMDPVTGKIYKNSVKGRNNK